MLEVFSSVGGGWTAATGEPSRVPAMSAHLVGASPDPIRTPLDTDLVPQGGLEAPDIVIVADLAFERDFDPRGRWPAEAAWLRARYAAGCVVCSVCTGALILAEAGLLNGHTVTTHWSATGLLSRHYPDLTLAPDRIMTVSSPDGRLITCGGAASWEDLALYLIARFRGAAEATRISRLFLFGDRSEGQLPFAQTISLKRHDDPVIAMVQSWIADNYDRDNAVAEMAARAGLPPRTFSRRFRAATGYSPIDYVQAVRIEEAKQMLTTTATPVDDIAYEVGYADPSHFRRLFRRLAGTTPSRYRQKFTRSPHFG